MCYVDADVAECPRGPRGIDELNALGVAPAGHPCDDPLSVSTPPRRLIVVEVHRLRPTVNPPYSDVVN